MMKLPQNAKGEAAPTGVGAVRTFHCLTKIRQRWMIGIEHVGAMIFVIVGMTDSHLSIAIGD
jgi:hypothetical protein